jgi:hypothetical protein
METKDKDGNVIVPVVEIDPIAEKDKEIAKISEERDNYKRVALKRLGKLPGDEGFIKGADESTGLTVEEMVQKALLDNEYARLTSEKDEVARKLLKENSELRLALKNRPETSIGGGDAGAPVVATKDNVLTPEQEADIRKRAEIVGADPEKVLETAKKNLAAKR